MSSPGLEWHSRRDCLPSFFFLCFILGTGRPGSTTNNTPFPAHPWRVITRPHATYDTSSTVPHTPHANNAPQQQNKRTHTRAQKHTTHTRPNRAKTNTKQKAHASGRERTKKPNTKKTKPTTTFRRQRRILHRMREGPTRTNRMPIPNFFFLVAPLFFVSLSSSVRLLRHIDSKIAHTCPTFSTHSPPKAMSTSRRKNPRTHTHRPKTKTP